ncbi:MAG: hypothetical protein U5O39_11895 [Gammaproteobacteria bacterium]|nr:hypothetical protein [Gammaproteobacteria bacterium]
MLVIEKSSVMAPTEGATSDRWQGIKTTVVDWVLVMVDAVTIVLVVPTEFWAKSVVNASAS